MYSQIMIKGKIWTEVGVKCFGEPLKFEEDLTAGNVGKRYVYRVSCRGTNYTLKGFRIQIEHLDPMSEGSAELFKEGIGEISEVLQEYYFAKTACLFNPHMAKPFDFDTFIDVAKDLGSNSFMCIETIFEDGGESLNTLKPVSIDLTYNLIRQSANALFLLHNIGIVHFDIKPENMVYDSRKDLLKLIDIGNAYGVATRGRIGASTVKFEGKMRSTTPEYAPPEVLREMGDPAKTLNVKLTLDAVDVYC
eukprot:TRINITY_DN2494_c0_g1_i3.p1 TRINITY_DN2494_c0_g1~~TRINITY_DN2494_c0_g1_i3.p1  ORF type:complete len:249 (+),score=53.45 TRINITY_DN2494_c0_g1_i3:47-793(+)